MSAPRVLVTGGAGFIGSHVAEALVAQGADVRVLDNLSTGFERNLETVRNHLQFVCADVLDFEALDSASAGCSAIVHLAAEPSVQLSIREPLKAHQANYVGTLHMLEAARRAGVRRIVYLSSASVYSPVATPPAKETDFPSPSSPYGVDKLAGEFILGAYERLYGIRTSSLRAFNIYGERQDPHSPYSGVIGIFAERCLIGRPITIFGDGRQSRDFVYVKDLARLVTEIALERLQPPKLMNVGTGRPVTLLQLVELLGEVTGRSPMVQFEPARVGDLEASWADPARLEALGPREWTDLRAGLTQLVEWMKVSSEARENG